MLISSSNNQSFSAAAYQRRNQPEAASVSPTVGFVSDLGEAVLDGFVSTIDDTFRDALKIVGAGGVGGITGAVTGLLTGGDIVGFSAAGAVLGIGAVAYSVLRGLNEKG